MADTRCVPHLESDKDKIQEDIEILDTDISLSSRVQYEYDLFRRIWNLPANRPMRSLVRKYMWPNIREWKRCVLKNPGNQNTLNCYHVALKNALTKLAKA